MMHYEEFVAVLCDTNKKPLRELDNQKLDNGRKAKVFMPFDSEYQLLIKNNSDSRINIKIDIDGTNVSSSGLIISAHSNDYIERFVDVAKKFKFVKASNEGVSDPSNLENGVVKIRIVKERKLDPQPIVPQVTEVHHHHYNSWVYPTRYGSTVYGANSLIGDCQSQQVNYCRTMDFNNLNVAGSIITTSSIGNDAAISSALRSFAPTKKPLLESGATIEGAASSQTFQTTFWNGDAGLESVFTFHLFGTDSADRQKKLDEYLKLKAELGI